ncbi:hypothetical protein GWN26_14475 [Candidatus Saccharibacteria bacterium]|nr:hypothetical protein [Candidatus Saccharibacteria bacterium]NIW78357.1 hypothetical protein [Calditrichia bacterium]
MALSSAKWEISRGIGTVLLAGGMLSFYTPQSFDLLRLGLVFVLISGIKYLASPFMAIVAEYELSKEGKPVSRDSGDFLKLLGNRIYNLLFYSLWSWFGR